MLSKSYMELTDLQKRAYKKIVDMVTRQNYTIRDACESIGISCQTFYNIGKKMEKKGQNGGYQKKQYKRHYQTRDGKKVLSKSKRKNY